MIRLEPQLPRTEDPLPELSRDEMTQLLYMARMIKAGTIERISIELHRKEEALLITAHAVPIVYRCHK